MKTWNVLIGVCQHIEAETAEEAEAALELRIRRAGFEPYFVPDEKPFPLGERNG